MNRGDFLMNKASYIYLVTFSKTKTSQKINLKTFVMLFFIIILHPEIHELKKQCIDKQIRPPLTCCFFHEYLKTT